MWQPAPLVAPCMTFITRPPCTNLSVMTRFARWKLVYPLGMRRDVSSSTLRFASVSNRPDPQGVTLVDGGVNVALFADHATAVDFCVRNPDGSETRWRLPDKARGVWHGFVPASNQALATAFAYTANGIQKKAIAIIRTSSSSTLMPKQSTATGFCTRQCSATNTIPKHLKTNQFPTTATLHLSCRAALS